MSRKSYLTAVVTRYARSISSSSALDRSFNRNGFKKSAKHETTVPPRSFLSSCLKFTPVAWLIRNAMGIAFYQLVLEGILTAVCSLMFLGHYTTTAGIRSRLESCHYPFTSFVDWDGGQHDQSFTVGQYHLTAEVLTAAHTAHNIASGLLPLQLVVLALTFPAARRVWVGVSTRSKALWPHKVEEQISNNPYGKRRNYRR
ncbi:hypothetical protein, conserved [Trypanosoma brucei gambiense DAL972]|uniref:Uncharacterized protein n=2 Tax=Trypanosoma brucei TaxID=5691 RepID=D0A1M5_TRYB9|nr:hypothetical protein, conserved [Trypanosoma brucei gambiense DAL972]RHW69407.1 hypothetical protein DPX39_100026000 [Trypanosoma brucei equiperdum]CBH15167.1 hypothetical protein, conserved [Trypanosoma brucei gambiense DAL972]|eukprot:XP_011777433.1 hypothetical protein, conserved [Trypanosoma brucei gambiense DAL972]